MKISDMDREQLKEYMLNSGQFHRMDSESRAWQRAFELARGAGMGELDMGCTKCWDKVEKFIKK